MALRLTPLPLALPNTISPLGGFVINGEAAHDYSGWSVSSAGDVNGDGLDDLIVGAYFTIPPSFVAIYLDRNWLGT
jgi:hypothetical protein